MRQKRKAQIKMFETMGVLIVFFFLLSIGFAFYFAAQQSSIRKGLEESYQQKAFNTALRAMYLPEFDCSFLVTQKENCIDKIKMEEFLVLVQENESALSFYFDEFGDSRISVERIYPQFQFWDLYDSKPTGQIEQITTRTPILIYDAADDAYGFGVMRVAKYV